MAKIAENKKGFLVIEVSAEELSSKMGGYGICDFCNTPSDNGYFVSVLNQWLCSKCYNEWLKRAIRYPQDADIERRNFELFKEKLSL